MPLDIDSTVQALLDQGVTLDQIQSAAQKNTFDSAWITRIAAITEALPTVTADQITAFKSHVEADLGFDNMDLDRVGKKLWALVLAGDTASFVPALVLFVATIYRIRPDIRG